MPSRAAEGAPCRREQGQDSAVLDGLPALSAAPWPLQFIPKFLRSYGWDRRWHWTTSCPARAKLLGQDARHFLAWLRVWGLGGCGGNIPAAIPAPPRQFVHFLPWLQIPTISFSAASGLCPLPGPALTLRDRGPSCPASSEFGSSAALNAASAKKPSGWGGGWKEV